MRRPNATRLVIARVLHPSEKTEKITLPPYLQVVPLLFKLHCISYDVADLAKLYYFLLQYKLLHLLFVLNKKAQ